MWMLLLYRILFCVYDIRKIHQIACSDVMITSFCVSNFVSITQTTPCSLLKEIRKAVGIENDADRKQFSGYIDSVL